MSVTRLLYLAAALCLVVLAGCGPAAPAATPTPPTTAAAIQLSWVPNIEFAGLFMAEDEGFYAAEGLDVSILPGGFDSDGNYINPIDQVLTGSAQFGVTEGSDLLLARADGQDLVAVMALYQRHPFALVSRADKNIVRPQDLVGATVEVSPKGMPLYLALLASQNIDPASVNTRPIGDASLQRMFAGQVDVVEDWLINETGSMGEINSIALLDYGIDAYPNVVFTTAAFIQEHPDLVQRFVRATVKGLQAAIAGPDEAAALAVSHNADLNPDTQERGMQRSIPLLNPSGSRPGAMTATAWEFMHQVLVDQSIIEQPLDISKAYTTRFVDQVYANQ